MASHPSVLILTADVVGPSMAGPAIRATEIARTLASQQPVRLLCQRHSGYAPHGFEIGTLTDENLNDALVRANIVFFQGFITHAYPQILNSGKILVADLYDPFHLENLEMWRKRDETSRREVAASDLRIIGEQLAAADFFCCAGEKQRDFWLGHLAQAGRVNPLTYDADPTLRQLIDVVPFGIPDEPPKARTPVLKGVLRGIAPGDPVVLWGGGVYDWLDPLTAIRAIDIVRGEHPNVRLFFLGLGHPNPDVPPMRMATAAVELARERGLDGKHVFFNAGWVPYDERAGYFAEADIGISCHLDHIETVYSYRTRVLDYLWARLPVVVTGGDAMSQLVEAKGLGTVVPPGDAESLAGAIDRLLSDASLREQCRGRIEQVVPGLAWTNVMRPLAEFCANPRHAPDRHAPAVAARHPGYGPAELGRRARRLLKQGGLPLLRERARLYVRRRRG